MLKEYLLDLEKVYVGIGANLGDPFHTIQQAIALIEEIEGVTGLRRSPFYKTSPVSTIAQPDFINAVLSFECTLEPILLFSKLEAIEQLLGKGKKPKNAPRIIDLDLLFYGTLSFVSDRLTIPHPCWKERLFVLVPLLDLVGVDKFQSYNLQNMIDFLKKSKKQSIKLLV